MKAESLTVDKVMEAFKVKHERLSRGLGFSLLKMRK